MSPKILVVSPSAEVSEIAREMAPKGFETVVVHNDAEVVPNLPGVEYMITYPHIPMKDAFYKAVPKLRLVQLLSAGYDNVDLEAARRAKVPLSNNGGANAISVSEHAIMLMLTVARKVIWQHGSVSGGRWRGNGPAPKILPAARCACSAFSSITGPRDVFTRIACGFINSSSSLPIR